MSNATVDSPIPDTMFNIKEGLKDVLSSIIGSAACVYAGQPFDTVKVRLQVKPGQFTSTFSCLSKTVTNEGILALWKGSVPAFSGALAENAMAFGTNGFLKRIFRIDDEYNSSSASSSSSNGGSNGESEINSTDPKKKDIRIWGPLATASITGACVSVVLCPCDMMKCRAQVNIANGLAVESLGQMISKILLKSGPLGLYKGFAAQVLRDIPFYATFFGSYEILCQLFRKYTDWDNKAIYFLSGGFAGQIGWISSIAPDSIKSKIQTSDKVLSVAGVARDIYTQRGIRGFFVGVEVAVLRAFPANAALFMGYEMSRSAFATAF